MQWSLFLDDERFPAKDGIYEIARSVKEAQDLIEKKGAPVFVSLDHDLGDCVPTGMDFCKWLVDKDLDTDGAFLPKDFGYQIHSANPVGSKNMNALLEGYLDYKKKLNSDGEPVIKKSNNSFFR